MSVTQRGVVDAIGLGKADDTVVLTISDHLPWNGEDQHLLSLQEKINDYLEFLGNGQLYDEEPSYQGKPIRIEVACKFTPDEVGKEFLRRATGFVRGAGFDLSHYVSMHQ